PRGAFRACARGCRAPRASRGGAPARRPPETGRAGPGTSRERGSAALRGTWVDHPIITGQKQRAREKREAPRFVPRECGKGQGVPTTSRAFPGFDRGGRPEGFSGVIVSTASTIRNVIFLAAASESSSTE